MTLQLIKHQTNGKEIYGIDSRDVAIKIGKYHHHLSRDIRSYISAINENPALGSAEEFFVESLFRVANSNKSYPHFILTRKGCDMVANKMTGKKGIQFTTAYINAFHAMTKTIEENDLLNIIDPKVAGLIPKSFSECLRAYANEVDNHEKTKEALAETNKVLVETKPKADYFDALVDTNLLTNFRDAAKELGVRPLDLTNLLVIKKFIYRDKFKNIKPYAGHAKYFHIREFSNTAGYGTQTFITPAGRNKIRQLVEKENLKKVS